ncbi:hypothetical protein SO802_006130 [Lithocarpus litseifolius]|uniref:Uncharacterized protein n=1 Tax=Lithocarpus litseifolius TaxID=425828 RepID=A0AAW2DKF5_9ROSI
MQRRREAEKLEARVFHRNVLCLGCCWHRWGKEGGREARCCEAERDMCHLVIGSHEQSHHFVSYALSPINSSFPFLSFSLAYFIFRTTLSSELFVCQVTFACLSRRSFVLAYRRPLGWLDDDLVSQFECESMTNNLANSFDKEPSAALSKEDEPVANPSGQAF